MNYNAKISIVTPVYGAPDCLNELYNRLKKSVSAITENFEIIMVNDASPDNSWEIIKELTLKDNRVKGINFSRNFGQHYAITAGLNFASGDWIVVMDCDLQDQPEEIIKLYNKCQQSYDVVFARRQRRKDNFFKKMSSKLFYKIFDYFTESNTDNTIANFGIYSKKVINNFNKMDEHSRSFPLFIKWLGFNTAYIDVEHGKRHRGKSAYSLKKLLRFAIDNIITQSNKPLRLSIQFGFFLSFLAIIFGIYLVIRHFILDIPVQGWTSIMVSLFFIGGLLFANLGLVGLYLGRIFNEVKNRPLYIIKKTTNINNTKKYD